MAGDNDSKNDSKKERGKEKKSESSKEQKSSKKSLEKPDVQQVSSVGSGGETAGGSADAIATETIDVLRDIPSNQLVQFMSALNKFVAYKSADGSPDSHLAYSGPAKNSSPVRSKPVQFQKDVHVPGRIGAGSKAAKALPYSPISDNSSDDESLLPVDGSDSDEGDSIWLSASNRLKTIRKHPDLKYLITKEKTENRGLSSDRDKYYLNIKSDFNGTFLMDPQHISNKCDSIGLWPPGTAFPNAKSSSYNPPSSACRASPTFPRRLPYKFEDEKMEYFFKAKQMGPNHKFQVDSSAFDAGAVVLNPYNNFSVQDKILRDALLDNIITDSLIEAGNTRLSAIIENWDHVLNLIKKGDLDFKIELGYLLEISKLAFASNLKSRNDIIAAFASNKVLLRDRILFSTAGAFQTRDMLKRTSLFSSEAFGDLPESFINALNASAGNPYSSLSLKVTKRENSSSKTSDNKKFKEFHRSPLNIPGPSSASLSPSSSATDLNQSQVQAGRGVQLPARGRGAAARLQYHNSAKFSKFQNKN